MDNIKASKFLSFVLRHNPQEIGIALDDSGWVDVDVLLAACAAHGKRISRDQLFQIVEESDKQRFALNEGSSKIRANQGHSINVDLGYISKTPPAVLYHGTAERFIDSIKRSGLVKGQRHHVHLSESLKTASAVGQRYGKLKLLKIEAACMNADGFVFFQSDNGVWLTEHVPPQYIDFEFEAPA